MAARENEMGLLNIVVMNLRPSAFHVLCNSVLGGKENATLQECGNTQPESTTDRGRK